MKVRIIFFLLICFVSCNSKIQQAKPYIITFEDLKIKQRLDSIAKANSGNSLLPVKGFYGASNLIIDSDNNIYFYQTDIPEVDCYYGTENDTLPHFLDLQTKDIIKIPKKFISEFVNEIVMTKIEQRQILIIGSQKDTIKDLDFLNFIHNTKVPTYLIRRTTQEEDTVLKYHKTGKKYYDEKNIKWDKSKIKISF